MPLSPVELFPESNMKIGSLHDRLLDDIYDYAEHVKESEDLNVSLAEILGVLELVKITLLDI